MDAGTAEEEAAPPCPICLADIAEPADRAVVLDCLHVFCVECISRWAKLRRECPLCKGFFSSFIFDIESPSRFKERQLSPLRLPDKDVDGSVAALLRDAQEQYAAWRLAPPPGPRRPADAVHRSSHSRRASNPERRTTPLSEPRPYYYRLQRNLNARVGDSQGPAAAAAAPADATLEWRRSVYSRGLWAVPAAVPSAAAPAPTPAVSKRWLEEFVTRELRALLEADDVVVVKGLVMALLRLHLPLTGGSSSSSAGGGSSGRPADALRPFLHDDAEHFWHELRNFAASPFSMQTYDRLCRYASPEVAAAVASRSIGQHQQPSSGPADAAGSLEVRPPGSRASRWETPPSRGGQRGLSAPSSSGRRGDHSARHDTGSHGQQPLRPGRHRGQSAERPDRIGPEAQHRRRDAQAPDQNPSAQPSDAGVAAFSARDSPAAVSEQQPAADASTRRALRASHHRRPSSLEGERRPWHHRKRRRRSPDEPRHRERSLSPVAQDVAPDNDRWQMG